MAGGKVWSKEEDSFLELNYEDMTIFDMANQLQRSKSGVQHRLCRLGFIRKEAEVGDEFERLTIKEIYYKHEHGQQRAFAKFLCKCGQYCEHRLSAVVQGQLKSCGCLKREKAAKRCKIANYKHGHGNMITDRLYRIWSGVKSRCYNKNQPSFEWYGEKGIEMCDEWLKDFQVFYDWSITHGYTDKLTLDRIDGNKNYCPENCKWSTYKEQALNRASTRRFTNIITAWNETKSADEWMKDNRCIVKMGTLCHRLGAGWEPEKAMNKPSQR